LASRSTARIPAPHPTPRPAAAASAARALRPADGDADAASLPGARQLQDALGARLALADEASAHDGRWSPRRMLAFAVCASAALWGGIAAGGYLLLRS
jgi:hypothetical protein